MSALLLQTFMHSHFQVIEDPAELRLSDSTHLLLDVDFLIDFVAAETSCSPKLRFFANKFVSYLV